MKTIENIKTLNRINAISDITDKNINNYEGISIETIQNEVQKEKFKEMKRAFKICRSASRRILNM